MKKPFSTDLAGDPPRYGSQEVRLGPAKSRRLVVSQYLFGKDLKESRENSATQ